MKPTITKLDLPFIVPKKQVMVKTKVKYDITPVLHLLCTLQVINDEIEPIPNSIKIAPFKHELKKAANRYYEETERFIRALTDTNKILESIWTVANEDNGFDAFVEVKRRLIQRMSFAKFEEINEMDAILTDAQYRLQQLDTFELILNTHVPSKSLRDKYREKLNYTEEQYKQQKAFQEKELQTSKTLTNEEAN